MNPKLQGPTQSELSNSTSKNKLLDLKGIVEKAEELEAQTQERAAELESKSHELKILEETHNVKSKALKEVLSSAERAEKRLKEVEEFIRLKGEEKKILLKDVSRVRQSLKTTLEDIKKKASAKRFELETELKEIEISVRDRAEFYAEQERVRQDSLTDLSGKVAELEKTIPLLKDTVDNMSHERDTLTQVLSDLRFRTAEEANKLQASIDKQLELADVDAKRAYVKRLEEKAKVAEHKLIQLREKEESLMSREEANRQRSEDLAVRERRLSSKERLYRV